MSEIVKNLNILAIILWAGAVICGLTAVGLWFRLRIRNVIKFLAAMMVMSILISPAAFAEDVQGSPEEVEVQDLTPPIMDVYINDASNELNGVCYYNKNINITVRIMEENFLEEESLEKFVFIIEKDDIDREIPYEDLNVSQAVDSSGEVIPDIYDINYKIFSGEDGEYRVKVQYVDRAGNNMVDPAGNEMDTYISNLMIMDATRPRIDVEFSGGQVANIIDGRSYYDSALIGTITITEKNFHESGVNLEKIRGTDHGGRELTGTFSFGEWEHEGDIHTLEIYFPGEANYTFDVEYADMATNAAADYQTTYFTVDSSGPENLEISYSKAVKEVFINAILYGFYNTQVAVTVSAQDEISGVNSFIYNLYDNGGTFLEPSDIQVDENGRGSMTFYLPLATAAEDGQFDGIIGFQAVNRAGIYSQEMRGSRRIVVDNIAPEGKVTFSQAASSEGDISYHNEDIKAVISIQETNFSPEDVSIEIVKNGEAYPASASWESNGNEHVGTISISGDGQYRVIVSYSDKSANAMTEIVSENMVIDTEISQPDFSINNVIKNISGGTYMGDVQAEFDFTDANFAGYSARLIRTSRNGTEDVTDLIKLQGGTTGGKGVINIPQEREQDGIYTLEVQLKDKAGNSTEKSFSFNVNRYGSIFVYGDYLSRIIEGEGKYLSAGNESSVAVQENLVITEYNPDELTGGKGKILVTRDGEPVDVIFFVKEEAEAADNDAWKKYVYTINKENFLQDGEYKISLISYYETEDLGTASSVSLPDNSEDAEGNRIENDIRFVVDNSPPAIQSIQGLEHKIINSSGMEVGFTAADAGGIARVEVYLDDELILEEEPSVENIFMYQGRFVIPESSEIQHVRLRVVDLAGNEIDTEKADISKEGLYVFEENVLVSTNFLARLYANKAVFAAAVAGVIAVLAAAILAIVIGIRRASNGRYIE